MFCSFTAHLFVDSGSGDIFWPIWPFWHFTDANNSNSYDQHLSVWIITTGDKRVLLLLAWPCLECITASQVSLALFTPCVHPKFTCIEILHARMENVANGKRVWARVVKCMKHFCFFWLQCPINRMFSIYYLVIHKAKWQEQKKKKRPISILKVNLHIKHPLRIRPKSKTRPAV